MLKSLETLTIFTKKLKILGACLLLVLAGQAAKAQLPDDVSPKEFSCTENSARILILGTYHMNNPGQDTYNTQADDVLAPKRQKEITELIEKLARFKPT